MGIVAYTLKLPKGSKIHPSFHVSLLNRCPDPKITPIHLPADLEMPAEMRELAKILDRRTVRRKGRAVIEVLMRWQGETNDDAMWELWQGLQNKFPAFAKETHP